MLAKYLSPLHPTHIGIAIMTCAALWATAAAALQDDEPEYLCAYLFWDHHQWDPRRFDWSGQADTTEFCQLAQQEGLWVILRPSPPIRTA